MGVEQVYHIYYVHRHRYTIVYKNELFFNIEIKIVIYLYLYVMF